MGQRGWELRECIKSAVILPLILISFRGKGRKEEGKERKSFRQHVLRLQRDYCVYSVIPCFGNLVEKNASTVCKSTGCLFCRETGGLLLPPRTAPRSAVEELLVMLCFCLFSNPSLTFLREFACVGLDQHCSHQRTSYTVPSSDSWLRINSN